MDNVNNLIRKFIIPILFFVYLFFLLWEHNHATYDRKMIAMKLQNIALKLDKIDGVILGGSNTFFGLSALKLSHELQSDWINLSLLNEGYSNSNYNDFISQTIPKSKRESVSYVVLGTITLHRKGRIAAREESKLNVFGGKSFNLLPDRNLAGFLKDIFIKNEGVKYPVPDNYGDFNFEEFNCNIEDARPKYIKEDKDIIEKSLNKRFATINNFFPNAKILLLIPTEFKGEFHEPSSSKILMNNIEEIIRKERLSLGVDIKLVHEFEFNNTDYFCDTYHHANKLGRNLITDNLISYLK